MVEPIVDDVSGGVSPGTVAFMPPEGAGDTATIGGHGLRADDIAIMALEREVLPLRLLEDEVFRGLPLDVGLSDDGAAAIDTIIEALARAGAEKESWNDKNQQSHEWDLGKSKS